MVKSILMNEIPTLEQFIEKTLEHSLRLVKLKEDGFTAPMEMNGGVVIQPQVRFRATAFDKLNHTIYRWQEEKKAAEVGTLEHIKQRLLLEGLMVEKGEWTTSGVETLLPPNGI
jgi:hypothetical protein